MVAHNLVGLNGGGGRRPVEDDSPGSRGEGDVRERAVVGEVWLGCGVEAARDPSGRGRATLDRHVPGRVVRRILEVPDDVEGSLTARRDGGIRLDGGGREEEGQG